ncbi:MAG: hypothetical protein QXT64_05395 [Desulfurococcaceae archaeon]
MSTLKPVECKRCNYVYFTKSTAKRVKCPRCGYSNENPYASLHKIVKRR